MRLISTGHHNFSVVSKLFLVITELWSVRLRGYQFLPSSNNIDHDLRNSIFYIQRMKRIT